MRIVNRDGSISERINGKEVRVHRKVYESYYKCRLLPWTSIRHKNGINDDNRPENLDPWTRRTRADQFGKWAKPIPNNRRCAKCRSHKTTVHKDGRAHWFKNKSGKGYLCCSCFHKEYRDQVINRHRRLYEEYYKCSLLSWGQIHFINGNKKDMRIENMQLLLRGGSARMKMPRIPKDRRCMNTMCYSPWSAKGDWTKRPGGYLCNSCRSQEARMEHRDELKEISEDVDEPRHFNDYAKRKRFDPNFRPWTQCAICHSRTTGNKKGKPRWYKYPTGDRETGLSLCSSCYSENYHISNPRPSTAGLVRPWQKALKGVVLYPEISKMHDRVRRDEKNALKRAKRRALNVSIPTYIPRHLQEVKYCVDCGSTTTSKNIKGNPNWYRIEVPIGPIGYLDNNCFRKRVRRLKREAKGLPVLVSRKGETDSEKRERLNALQWAKRQALKPQEPPKPPRRCVECGS